MSRPATFAADKDPCRDCGVPRPSPGGSPAALRVSRHCQARAPGHRKMRLRPRRASPRMSRSRPDPGSRDVDHREDHRPAGGPHCRGVTGTTTHDRPSDRRLRRDRAVKRIGFLGADEDPDFFLDLVAVLALDDLRVIEGLLQVEDASFEAGPLVLELLVLAVVRDIPTLGCFLNPRVQLWPAPRAEILELFLEPVLPS